MKLSAKKKGEIYDLLHEQIMKARLTLQGEGFPCSNCPFRNKMDYVVAQLEIPIAQKVMDLIEGKI